MSRIDATFAALRARGETALLPYLSVGFPAPGETLAGRDLTCIKL